ncbi:MAG TPA: hypothetical protein VFI95_05125 [Terriglobales bacterium]|nr:hypothetical protein [Terriglobales bacterium]
MKLSSLLLGGIFGVAVLAVLLVIAGVRFERPLTSQGAALYNPANEIVVKGVVEDVQEFSCPVGDWEVGTHLTLKTEDGVMRIHLAPSRILRSQKIIFAPGDHLSVVGSKFRYRGSSDVIARNLTRGSEDFIIRDREGKLLLVQQ